MSILQEMIFLLALFLSAARRHTPTRQSRFPPSAEVLHLRPFRFSILCRNRPLSSLTPDLSVSKFGVFMLNQMERGISLDSSTGAGDLLSFNFRNLALSFSSALLLGRNPDFILC
jgi:hypothetical protein